MVRIVRELLVIRVQCPHCQRRYRTEMEAFGRTAVCTKCFQTFEIGESRPAFEWKQTDIAEDSWIGVAPPEEKRELKHCINCDAPLEPGAARCLACGANQVTGLVERIRRESDEKPPSRLLMIPLRPILIAAVAAILAFGAYHLVRSVTRSAAQIGDEITDQTLLVQAGKRVREGEDSEAFRKTFGARVTDENLPRFVRALSSPDAGIRRTVVALIGCGQIEDVGPVLRAAEARETAEAGHDALDAIGVRRLVALASQGAAPARESAAKALCLLCELPASEETIRRLREPADVAQKVQVLNALCGAWPQGAGGFVVTIDQIQSPFTVFVEQVGRAFYLRVGTREFCSSLKGQRRFEIPIDQWCAATGAAVDAAGIRELASGSVTLVPIIGGGWQGLVRVTAKRSLRGPFPGFLPVGDLERGRTAEARVRLSKGPS